jgi:hypothetical protein
MNAIQNYYVEKDKAQTIIATIINKLRKNFLFWLTSSSTKKNYSKQINSNIS